MNPGDTPESELIGPPVPSLNEGRGVNPGDTRGRPRSRTPAGALNEGRGVNPGDTGGLRQGGRDLEARSTKAGA